VPGDSVFIDQAIRHSLNSHLAPPPPEVNNAGAAVGELNRTIKLVVDASPVFADNAEGNSVKLGKLDRAAVAGWGRQTMWHADEVALNLVLLSCAALGELAHRPVVPSTNSNSASGGDSSSDIMAASKMF
jgi:hypothetical protein